MQLYNILKRNILKIKKRLKYNYLKGEYFL
nr:MAG TPA: hypothetical protein [Caudoviricetes sp.]